MADALDSDTYIGVKLTIEETQALPQRPNSPSATPEHSSEIVSAMKQDSEFIKNSCPACLASDSAKKVKLSPEGRVCKTHFEEIQEIPNSVNGKSDSCDLISKFLVSDGFTQVLMDNCEAGLVSDVEFVKTDDSLDDEKERVASDFSDKKVQGPAIGEVDFARLEKFVQFRNSVTASECNEGLDASLLDSVENKVLSVGKAAESESSLELKKKLLLEEVESILVPAKKTHLKSSTDGCVSTFKIEVIDDTAMIQTFTVPKSGNGRGKEMGFVDQGAKYAARRKGNKNARQEMNGKKEKTSGIKERVANHLFEAPSLRFKNERGTKMTYSRMELEAMRFMNVAEQKNLWKDIYRGLGSVVAKEYDNLTSAKHEKNIPNNFEPRKRFEKMEVAPAIRGEVFSENGDSELEYLVNKEIQDASPMDPFCSYSANNEDGYQFPEKECSEDDDSYKDYASIQKPAFAVEGEPNFDSGSPEDGLEYLRRVRWEAARIPKVRVAKADRNKFNREQSAYMPKIPDIAKCPEQLLPLKLWEDAFVAEFSELRLDLSRFEGSTASSSQGPHQKSDHIILETFANFKSKETDFHWPHDGSILGSSIDRPSLSSAERNNASLPTESTSPASMSTMNRSCMSVILRMDSVARVSMLRKRIKALEGMSTLSRGDCLWLFALCAVVDIPLDADTSASLRSLLRKCAALRAAKSILDDEVVMLNILATISGRYFGQSEN